MPSRKGLITGCGKGIGFACAKEFLKSSSDGILLGISRNKTKDITDLEAEYSERFYFFEQDINHHSEINSTITNFQDKNGLLDFAICNAGMRSRISIKGASIDTYRQVLETNTLSQINIVQHIYSTRPVQSKLLSILVVSSIVGQRGFAELSTYGVSKAALEGFVKSASVELADQNILINSLNPGFAKSSYEKHFRDKQKDLYEWTLAQTPLNRWGECYEIANLALFLVSPKNSYMTGSVVYCDGGWTSK